MFRRISNGTTTYKDARWFVFWLLTSGIMGGIIGIIIK